MRGTSRYMQCAYLYCYTSWLSLVSAQNGFISPKYQLTTEPGRFAANSIWPLGSSQIVAFNSNWDEYRIELWQQSLASDSATLSTNLVYNQISGEDLPQSFYWTVQTYELQFSDSPVFFFWLRDNNSEDQQTSALFNITIDLASGTSNTVVVSTTIAPTSTTRNSTHGMTAASTVHATSKPSSETEESSGGDSGGLSGGATAGIGVGVSMATISVIGLAGFLFYKWRKRNIDTQSSELAADSYSNGENKMVPTTEVNELQPGPTSHRQASPVELVG
ncbi:hypothetical protein F5X99DRAFT_396307 [Biscogniauxia marginata]|nr:hypothetical protein F5X99DRAFT_396307 [Biscogniauxia marginata]